MSFLKNRLPTKRETFLLFTLSFVIIYSWSILAFFNYLPGWLLFLDGWSIAGIFAYSQVFSLFESLLALIFMVTIAAALPRRLFRERFVAQGVVTFILAAIAAAVLHVTHIVPLWPSKTLIFGVLAYVSAVVVLSVLIQKHEPIRKWIESLVDRMVVLVYPYLALVAISLVIILIRNIF